MHMFIFIVQLSSLPRQTGKFTPTNTLDINVPYLEKGKETHEARTGALNICLNWHILCTLRMLRISLFTPGQLVPFGE